MRVERGLALAAVLLGAVTLLAATTQTWVTVPAALTGRGREVALPGAVLMELALLYGIVALGLLLALVRASGWSRSVAGLACAGIAVLGVAQSLDVALFHGKAVVRADEGPERLGYDDVGDRDELRAVEAAELPGTAWPWVALTGVALVGVGGSVVVARGRRWDELAPADDDAVGWWRT